MDVGCGKGKFLIERALAFPRTQFIGIERHWRWVKLARARANQRGLVNLQIVEADVREFARSVLPPESVNVFHIYFPDPWPKRKHRRRRLVTAEFLELLHERLKPTGLIELLTDDLDYRDEMKREMDKAQITWSRIRESENQRMFSGEISTLYEDRYRKFGRTLFYLELQKGGRNETEYRNYGQEPAGCGGDSRPTVVG